MRANAIQATAAFLSRSSQRVSCASSRASSSALVDRPARYRPSRPTPLGRFLAVSSLNEPLVGEALADRPADQAVKARQRMVLDVALIEAERKFIDVARKMLRAGRVIDAVNAALKNSEHAFNSVRASLAANVFACLVVDRDVNVALFFNAGIGRAFVAVDGRAGLDILDDGAVNDRSAYRSAWRQRDRRARACQEPASCRQSRDRLSASSTHACSALCRQHRFRQFQRCLAAFPVSSRTPRAAGAERTKPTFA